MKFPGENLEFDISEFVKLKSGKIQITSRSAGPRMRIVHTNKDILVKVDKMLPKK